MSGGRARIGRWTRTGVAAPSSACDRQDTALGAAAARQPFRLPAGAVGVDWVRPEIVVEVSFVEFTPDGLLRHVVYLGEREDKPAIEVRRDPPRSG